MILIYTETLISFKQHPIKSFKTLIEHEPSQIGREVLLIYCNDKSRY